MARVVAMSTHGQQFSWHTASARSESKMMPTAGSAVIPRVAHLSLPLMHCWHILSMPTALPSLTTLPASIAVRCAGARSRHSFRNSICCSTRCSAGFSPAKGIMSSSAAASPCVGRCWPGRRSIPPCRAIFLNSRFRILAVRGSTTRSAASSSRRDHPVSATSSPVAPRCASAIPTLRPAASCAGCPAVAAPLGGALTMRLSHERR
mmetsp:Transcript_27981/g.58266  ORF Transcript_27981/g.58266 Transcript_27981/m.58266 type:complete len:206 (+) Transcript_27981:403-1020(+)